MTCRPVPLLLSHGPRSLTGPLPAGGASVVFLLSHGPRSLMGPLPAGGTSVVLLLSHGPRSLMGSLPAGGAGVVFLLSHGPRSLMGSLPAGGAGVVFLHPLVDTLQTHHIMKLSTRQFSRVFTEADTYKITFTDILCKGNKH